MTTASGLPDLELPDPEAGLAHRLHVLLDQLDRVADTILQAEFGATYSRYLTLLQLRALNGQAPTAASQRALAARLGVSEPAVSRMTAALAEAGLLRIHPAPGGGNRRSLLLTASGEHLVTAGSARLETAFAALLRITGVDEPALDAAVRRLLEALGTSAVLDAPGAPGGSR